MDRDRDKMAERILHLTLEILFRLTGEDYTVVKKTSSERCQAPVSEGWRRPLSPITGPPPHSLIHEDINDQKILELTYKMIELLNGEAPIRCQDVAVYFSMEEWEYIEGHKDLYKDVMMEDPQPLTSPVLSSERTTPERCPSPLLPQECKQENPDVPQNHQFATISDPLCGDILYKRILLIDPSRMDDDRDKMAERILHLTLEILFWLTGEDYTVVKKTSSEHCQTPVSEGWGKLLSPITGPPPHPLIHEDINDQKILELTYKMIELLTGEVPIRCQDVAIYFSMEEWEYLEGHKDLYKDVMMEVPQPLTSPVLSSKKTKPERCPRPLLPQNYKQKNPNAAQVHQEEEEIPRFCAKQKKVRLLKPSIGMYRRMAIDVRKLIGLVETMPQLWNSAAEGYRDRHERNMCWTSVCRDLYPEWDDADCQLQYEIERDVRKRWRSVRDRFHKFHATAASSGSTFCKKKYFYEQLQFLLTRRTLRHTESNVASTEKESNEGTVNRVDFNAKTLGPNQHFGIKNVLSSKKITLETCPRPLLPQDCKQESPDVPQAHQEEEEIPTFSAKQKKVHILKSSISMYRRMAIDVRRLIGLVKTMPQLWDAAAEGYRDRHQRNMCWTSVCRDLYPEWDDADCQLQYEIERDVRKRWRSVRDRFHKFHATAASSGSTFCRKKYFYEELQFLLTRRTLRHNESNVASTEKKNIEGTVNRVDFPAKTLGPNQHFRGTNDLSSKKSTPETCPRPLLSQGSKQENPNVPQVHQDKVRILWKSSINMYRRMSIDVRRLIGLVESKPELWNSASADFTHRQKKADSWTWICRQLYPQWDEADVNLQLRIDGDVRKRWRSVRARFMKFVAKENNSGSSPNPNKCAFYNELQFTLNSRDLRPTQGHILPQLLNEDLKTENEVTEPVQEPDMAESERPPSSSNASFGFDTEEMTSPHSSRASEPAYKLTQSRLSNSRAFQRVQRTPDLNSQNVALSQEVITMLRRSESEDRYDHLASNVSSWIRDLPQDRQMSFTAVLYSLLDYYMSPTPIPNVAEIINGIHHIFISQGNTVSRVGHSVAPTYLPNTQMQQMGGPNVYGLGQQSVGSLESTPSFTSLFELPSFGPSNPSNIQRVNPTHPPSTSNSGVASDVSCLQYLNLP
ncbi:uncharacterized protein ACNLHF_021715 isoform 2-T2 [Anomaloglossus baeobatrachus]